MEFEGHPVTWLLLILVPVLILYLTWSSAKFGPLTPSAVFAGMNGLVAVSIIPNLDDSRSADVVHGYILTYVLVVFCCFSVLLELPIPAYRRGVRVEYRPGSKHVGLLIFSIAVTLAYFFAVGYSALFAGIQNSLTSAGEDVAGLRLDSYAGSRYLFPGYVNQFKNVLLPALVVLGLMQWSTRRRPRVLLWSTLSALSIFALLGTGQRQALVLFSAVFMVFLVLLNNRTFSKKTFGLALGALLLLLLGTFALGRGNQEVSNSEGIVGKLSTLVMQVFERIVGSGGSGSIAGFRYVYEYKETAYGAEWLDSLLGLTPFSRGSVLPNEIFAYQWGSMRGNSPPSLWASIFHNFGLLGTILAPLLFALLLAIVTRAREKARINPHPVAIMGVAGVTVTLGFWTSGSPTFPINVGLVPYLLMWLVGAKLAKRSGRHSPTDGGVARSPIVDVR